MGAGAFSNEISQIANAHFNGRSDLKLLEAGCGSATHFKIAGIVKSVGIDISQQQLDRNPVIQEKILGDIQTHPLPADEFDVIICWDVLEHLPRPQEALANMCKAVRPGGLILMGFPHAASFKGIVTKSTPYWFHRLFYRYFLKYKSSPFPTFMRLAILPQRVIDFTKSRGCSVVYFKLAEGGVTAKFVKRVWGAGLFFAIMDKLWRFVAGAKSHSLRLDNCGLVLTKPPGAAAVGAARPATNQP